MPSTWRQWASGVAAFRLGAATSRHAFAMMGSLPLPDLTTPGRGHLPGSRRYRWQGHHGGVRRPHHPDQTYKDRVLGPGGRLPGSFGRLIRTPAARSVLNHHPVLPVVLIPPRPRWSWSTAMSLAPLGHLSRRQVPHGGKVGAVSGHRRQIGRLVRGPSVPRFGPVHQIEDLVLWSSKASELRDRLRPASASPRRPWRRWSAGRPCTLHARWAADR